MDLQYYVLGKKNNPMLLSYLDKYYVILQGKLQEIQQAGFLKDEIASLLEYPQNRKFILNADISSIINILYIEIIQKNPQGLGSIDTYIQKLEKEIGLFLSGEEDKLVMNQGTKIAGTNIRLTPIDNNPYSNLEAHPDHKTSGGVLGWGEKTEKEWLEVYTKTFEALKIIDEGFYDELNQIISKIIPLGTAYGLHNSCSHKDCVGHLYMGFTVDVDYPEFNNVEAIIHESSHNKLNLIMQSEKIILSDYSEKYYSPYRPDARHIHGVYIGLHAFAPVIYVLMAAYKKGLLGKSKNWFEKIMYYHLKNKIAYRVLVKHGQFSELGNEILAEMKYVMQLTEEIYSTIEGAKETTAIVLEVEKNHFRNVNINYPHLEY